MSQFRPCIHSIFSRIAGTKFCRIHNSADCYSDNHDNNRNNQKNFILTTPAIR